MNREQKKQAVINLTEQVNNATNLYLTDSSSLDVATINKFRGKCYENNIKFQVVKNSLLRKAFEASNIDYAPLYDVLVGSTSLMFSETANLPAKVLKEFREENEKPLLKAAFINSEVYLGDEMIKELINLKSKEQLIGEVIGLLQTPIQNVISALNSGGATIAGVVKTLSEREN